jgi:hypothetical protein
MELMIRVAQEQVETKFHNSKSKDDPFQIAIQRQASHSINIGRSRLLIR